MKTQKFIPLLVIAAGAWAYHNSFTGPFIYDDLPSITENTTIRHLWPIWQVLSPPHDGPITVVGRPLINLSLAINYALGGYQVWGYHAFNLTIHILAGLTLLGVVRRTLLQPRLRERFGGSANGLALATAVIWTVHPLQTESVTYVVQRAESLMGLFYLLTLYCFMRGAESRRPRTWYVLCVIACTLGMASKEVMASAPLMVMLYDRTFLSGSFREAWRRRRALYLALAGTWIVLGYLLFFTGNLSNELIGAESAGRPWGPHLLAESGAIYHLPWRPCAGSTAYLLTEPGVILHYLRLTVWPHPLCFDYYGWPIARTWTSILAPGLVVAILLGASVRACARNSAWGLLGAWFFLLLAPSSSFVPLDSPAYEHRMYLSLAAVIALLVIGAFVLGRHWVKRQPTQRMLGWGALGVLVPLLSILTIRHNEDYRSALVLWQDTVAKRPNNPRAHDGLGLALARSGRIQEAIGHYEQALRIRPEYAQTHYNLGLALVQAGRIQEAVEHYQTALRVIPQYAEVHNDLGIALFGLGEVPEALGHFEQAVRIKPDYAQAYFNLGNALARSGRAQDSIRYYQQALRIAPHYAEAHYGLGVVLLRAGKPPEAVPEFEQALRIRPEYPEARYGLAMALEQLGRAPEAVAQ